MLKPTKICAADVTRTAADVTRTANFKSYLVYRFMEIQGNTKWAKQNTIIEQAKCSDILVGVICAIVFTLALC